MAITRTAWHEDGIGDPCGRAGGSAHDVEFLEKAGAKVPLRLIESRLGGGRLVVTTVSNDLELARRSRLVSPELARESGLDPLDDPPEPEAA